MPGFFWTKKLFLAVGLADATHPLEQAFLKRGHLTYSSLFTQIQCITSPQLQYITSPQIQCITSPQIQCITAPQLQYITSPQIQCITSPQLQYITSPQIQCITSPQLLYITSPQIQCITSPHFTNSSMLILSKYPYHLDLPLVKISNRPFQNYSKCSTIIVSLSDVFFFQIWFRTIVARLQPKTPDSASGHTDLRSNSHQPHTTNVQGRQTRAPFLRSKTIIKPQSSTIRARALEGPMMNICRDCRGMIVNIIKASRT